MNRQVARALLALMSVGAVLLLAEAGFRMLPGSGEALRGLHRAEAGSPWLYALKPGARTRLEASGDVLYEVNAAGHRGPVVGMAKRSGVLRVLVLGDSVAFGYGVAEEDTFARRLEVAGAANLEVLNFGVGGYNPYNEAKLFVGKGVAYRPDIVLLQFCINDLNDPTSHFDTQTKLALGDIPDEAFPDPAERGPLAAQASCWLNPCGCSRVCSAAVAAMRTLAGEAEPLDVAALAPRDLPPGPARRWIGDRYREIADASQEIGARFAVVVFPYRGQVERGVPAVVQEQLSELGREQGFEVIDLLPAFRAAAPQESLFLDLWHPTAAGHRVAADAIRARLQSLGWAS